MAVVEPFLIAEKVTSLPGQPQVSFQQFSRYITVDEKQQRALFFYFVEAELEPASKPLVLWLNGGKIIGDQDAPVPFTGSQTLVNGLAKELGLKITVPYRAWFEGKQVGGWTQVDGDNQLSFASIRGASHRAPATQPARSFSLFKAFLTGKPLPNA
ncbi:serine carboxypeptidase-like 45 [Quercus suber]|uniref:Serine carboxypeptidase-like 45 n=1 Tax=Quercus suber TaxID=58331 RepID=A0AAW0LNJ6_QUESU